MKPSSRKSAAAPHIRLVRAEEAAPARAPGAPADGLVGSYRRLTDIFHELLSEQSPTALLERIAETLAELVPYEALHIYEADHVARELVPMLARSEDERQIMGQRLPLGEGITGWVVERGEPVLANQAHLDPRVRFIPGTPIEPGALVIVPLMSRGRVLGTLDLHRSGDHAAFSREELMLATRLGDAAALALDNARIHATLEHQASTDPLTGLLNHRSFHKRLREELVDVSVARGTVALVMIDLDDFEKVNDAHGHAAGDDVLAELAGALRSVVRGGDAVCRIGGVEFAVILPGGDAERARGLAGRIATRVLELEVGAAGGMTVSVGIAVGPEHASTPRELIACAEAAMMTAKARGPGQAVVFETVPCRDNPRPT